MTTYNGEVTTVRDQANKQRRSTVDGLGRLITVEEMNEFPASTVYATTNYTYDSRGNLVTVTQAQPGTTQTRRFAYDLLSRLIFAANPEQNTTTDPLFTYNSQQWALRYDYDLASNLVTKTDTRLVNGSLPFVSISYQYDLLNRATQRSYSDGTPQVTYVYDTATNGVGRLRSVTASAVSSYDYTIYDALGRPAAYNQVTQGQTYSMSSTYNKAGLVVDETYPSGKIMHTDYDGAGRPAGVKKSTNSFYYAGAADSDAANKIQYSAHGAASVLKLGNSLWEHTNFNSRLQPTQIGLGVNQTSTSVLGLNYAYGLLVSGNLDLTKNNGNIESQIIAVSGTTIKQSYLYDQVNRLLSASEKVNSEGTPRWTQTYGYDRFGNRTSLTNTGSEGGLLPTQTTPAVNPATNRLTASPYDNAGNLTNHNSGDCVYDAENRIVQNGTHSLTAEYSYDGDGRRVIRHLPGPQSGSTAVQVYNAGGNLVAEYTSGPFEPFPPPPPPTNWKATYLTADHLGSTRVVTDQNQGIAVRRDYMPFGEEIPINVSGRTKPMGYGAADSLRQQFTQKERDTESGLDYFLARYYSSAQGRFTSPDAPLVGQEEKEPQSWNLYAYTSNNPLNREDPDGRRWFYKEDNGKIVDVQWVDANKDGSYTSPGDGYQAFIPTDQHPYLAVMNAAGTVEYHFGEGREGQPFARGYWTGKVEDATVPLVLDYLVGKAIGTIAKEAFGAWRAWRIARAAEKAGESASERLANLAGKSKGEARKILEKEGFQSKGSTQGGYEKWYHPDGSRVQIRPDGEVVRTAPKATPTGGGAKYRPRVGPDGKPTSTHNTGERVN